MHELFNAQNWSDLIHEDGFSTLVFFLCLLAVALPALLFSDHIQSWLNERQEKAKWQSFQRS